MTAHRHPGLHLYPELIAQSVKDTTGKKRAPRAPRDPESLSTLVAIGLIIVIGLCVAFLPKSCKAEAAVESAEWDGATVEGLDKFMVLGGWVRMPPSINSVEMDCLASGRLFALYVRGDRKPWICFKASDKFTAELAEYQCGLIDMDVVSFDTGIRCRKPKPASGLFRRTSRREQPRILFQHTLTAAEWDVDGGLREKRACIEQHGGLREHWYIIETGDGKTVFVLAVCVAQPNQDGERKET